MKKKMPTHLHKTTQHVFDAAGQSLGRLASQVAIRLQGKLSPEFDLRTIPDDHILIKNIVQLKFSDKKLSTHTIKTFSGFPGGLKQSTWRNSFIRDPQKFFIRVLVHMLPKNKRSSILIKHVMFE